MPYGAVGCSAPWTSTALLVLLNDSAQAHSSTYPIWPLAWWVRGASMCSLPARGVCSTGSADHWRLWDPHLHPSHGAGGLHHHRHIHTGMCRRCLGAPPPAQAVIHAMPWPALVQLGIYISCLVSHNSAKQTETLPSTLLPH